MLYKVIVFLLIAPSVAFAGDASVLDAINSYRKQNGLSLVYESEKTCALARERLQETKSYWGHRGFMKRSEELKKSGWWYENLARRFSRGEDVVSAWTKSPTHKRNMLANIRELCVERSGNYWVMIGHYGI